MGYGHRGPDEMSTFDVAVSRVGGIVFPIFGKSRIRVLSLRVTSIVYALSSLEAVSSSSSGSSRRQSPSGEVLVGSARGDRGWIIFPRVDWSR